jgi:hypothetical protein
MPVVVLEIDPEDLLQVPLPDDQQPVQALSADGTDPPLRVGVRVRRLDRRNEHLGALGAEHVVERATELGIPIAQQELDAAPLLAEHQQQVPCLLGDPGAVGVGSHAGEMDPAGVQLDEEQHVQPPKPDDVDGEEVTGEDPGGLLAQKRPPRHGRSPWRGVQAMAAERFADHGRRDAHVEAEQFALDPLVAPAWAFAGQADDQLLQFLVEWRSPGSAVRVGPGAGDQPPVPAQQRLRP